MTPLTCRISILCTLLTPLSLSGLPCHPCPKPQLDISATVNTRPGVSTPPVRAGSPVVVDYLLSNHGWTRLADVHVTEPGALGGSVSCDGGGDTVVLRHDASVDCVVQLTAAPGTHAGTVTVTARVDDDDDGDDDDDQEQVGTSATVGYQGIASSLSAADVVSTKRDSTGGQAALTYRATNTGSAPLFDFTATDSLPAGVTCPQPASGLAPGESLTCTGTAHLRPGHYHSSLTVSAGDRTTTVDVSGASVPPPKVTASAAADFDMVALPPPPSPPPPPPTTPPTTPPPTTTPPPPTTPAPPTPPSTPPSPPPPPPPTTPRSTPPTPTVPPPPPTPPAPSPPSPTATTPKPPKQEAAAMPSRPGLKTPLFLLVMMMPAAGAAAVLAARRK